MAIPGFQDMMLPMLKIMSDGYEYETSQLNKNLAQHFALTEDERHQLLPSGRQATFTNRVSWSVIYLYKTGLLEKVRRATYRITERGHSVLQENPRRIDLKFLSQFPELEAFRRSSSQENEVTIQTEIRPNVQTPDEIFESAYQELHEKLAEDLLDRIKTNTPQFFETLVIDLLIAMGYGGSRADAGEAIGRSGDEGIDGIIKEDRLGLDAIYVQAKRWEGTIGRPLIQAFAGSLEGQRAKKGIFITTSQFSKDARDYVSRIEKRIVLIDGEQLAQLMIEFGVGTSPKATYVLKKLDEDYFSEE
jgi:restriction system protein